MPSRRLSSSSSSSNSAAFFVAPIILAAIIFAIIFYLIYRRRRLHSSLAPSHTFSYTHLLAATNSFSLHNAIGRGASATVYRGVLPTGKSVAVKLIDNSSTCAQLEFQNELRILSRLSSPYVVALLGYCLRNEHRILVYEYMPNRSLQETLFSGSDLSWDHRFRIVQDVAKALAYLHLECDPPIIHGDVKPSNVLLDMDFRARVSDFGLSRVKEEDHAPPFSQEHVAAVIEGSSPAAAGSSGHYSYNEVDFAQGLQASASSKNENKDDLVVEEDSVDEYRKKRGCSGNCHEDARHCVVGEDLEEEGPQWGKDWWWRQDGSGELCRKDYITEWIGSLICPSTDNHGWDDDDDEEDKSASHCSQASSPVFNNRVQLQVPELGLAKKEGKRGREKKIHRKLHEWWKEEEQAEISKSGIKLRMLEKKWNKSFKKPILTFSRSLKLRRKRKLREHDTHYCDPESDFSFRRGWKKKKKKNKEADSGEVFSRELSSTTSMRGTLCYVAPECGGCGYLMEKADIYSLGVLILVIVSGRRPLHVLSSPLKLEKANLVSWCRHLAQSGDVLELVDMRLKQQGYGRQQATLCINLALSCLQKMPELRPDIGDVVKILNGEMDLPALPFDFSPSPPSKLLGRSRSRQ